ncbi:SPO22-domain-containing protein [Trichodelitschia bisporula]|uniref:SPO22-domain-containing protein n=1 Tax=Trichodelitschia bisporula TaxID=703511 RepID=A0A6G1I5X8_9PEZI|nr:SPO22-domain-containing protein [Trichodelitschia bisporula]
MAHRISAKAENNEKAKALIDFATSLVSALEASLFPQALAPKIRKTILTIPTGRPLPRVHDLDTKGTALWNLSTRQQRSVTSDSSAVEKECICLIRVFAFCLLDCAAQGRTGGGNPPAFVRLLRVGSKAAKACIEQGDLEMAVRVLERTASWNEKLEARSSDLSPEDAAVVTGLRGRYWMLRTVLAWKQSKLDVAEHMFQKVLPLVSAADPLLAEEIADIAYEVGKDLISKKNFPAAVSWLEKSYDLLAEQEPGRLSDNAMELGMSVMQQLVKALISMKTPEALAKAGDTANRLDAVYPEKLVAALVKLEVLSADASPDPAVYSDVLQRIFRIISLTETNFKMLMHRLHQLRKLSPEHACKALNSLLSLRLYDNGEDGLIERAAMMRIWIGTSITTSADDVQALSEALDDIHSNTSRPFSIAAAHAAQTLIWKQIESSFSQKQFDLAKQLCELALHPLFVKSGGMNQAKVSRKIILCDLEKHDFTSAREIFFGLSETQRNAPESRYLMYKVAMRTNDPELAADCLNVICRAPDTVKKPTLLYACVLDAQQVGNKWETARVLEKVLDRYDAAVPAGVSLPALLRCMVRLWQSEMSPKSALDGDAIESLSRVFERASKRIKMDRLQKPQDGTGDFDAQELKWFCVSNYNIILDWCATIDPVHLARLCESCLELMVTALEGETSPEDLDALRVRQIYCEFLATCAYTVRARAEDVVETSFEYYNQVHQHSQRARKSILEYLSPAAVSGTKASSLKSKHFELVKYELEALLRLSKWDEMDDLFNACWTYADSSQWETMADLALVVNEEMVKVKAGPSYQSKVLTFIQKIINKTWKTTSDLVALSRWMRCLFQMALSFDEKISLCCIDQAIRIAEKHKDVYDP